MTGASSPGHGVATPLWVLYVPVLLTAAFTDVPVKAIAYAIGASGLTLLATGVSHGFNKSAVVPLMLILAGVPADRRRGERVRASVNGVADAAHAERARQIEEVEQLREQLIEGHRAERETLLDETRRERAELKVKVDRLSEALASASRGDLSGYNDGTLGSGRR